MGIPAKLSDEEFIRLFEQLGARGMGTKIGQAERRIYDRRRTLERKYKRKLVSPTSPGNQQPAYIEHPGRICVSVPDGFVLIGSDAHYWPGPPSLMHRAFVYFCKILKPKIVIMNGDVSDFCSISRYPPIGWASMPTVQQEIEAAQARLHEIELAAGKARKIWPLGNHDSRFETRLGTVAPEFAKLSGFTLHEHFPLWETCWRVDINGNIVVKHRGKGGKHDAYQTALHSGVTTITGHSHCPFVRGITNVRGTHWGVNGGCIADPDDRAFLDYTEDSPYKDWRAAMVVLTFNGGHLLPPELVLQWTTDSVVFRGEIIRV